LLKPHHDSSTFTVNLGLNTPGVDYEVCIMKKIDLQDSQKNRRTKKIHLLKNRLTKNRLTRKIHLLKNRLTKNTLTKKNCLQLTISDKFIVADL
jgi:hypothetical protein